MFCNNAGHARVVILEIHMIGKSHVIYILCHITVPHIDDDFGENGDMAYSTDYGDQDFHYYISYITFITFHYYIRYSYYILICILFYINISTFFLWIKRESKYCTLK